MVKNILVFWDGGEQARRGLELAVHLAQLSAGRVRGLFVKSLIIPEISAWSPGPEAEMGTPAIFDPALVAELEGQQERLAQQLAEAFIRRTGEQSLGLEVARGDLVGELVTASRTADLVVMGRGGGGTESKSWRLSEITRRVLKKCWAPVLLPPVLDSLSFTKSYLLAYDGSPAANRVMRQIARLALLTGAAVTVLSVGDPVVTAERLHEAQTFLQPYSLAVNLEAREGKPEAVIQALVLEQDFGLIGLGAHGHHRIKDLLLGTTTDKLLQEVPQAFLSCAL